MAVATCFGQPYANDWINYAQTYYKIPVTEEGIYRLTYAELQNANFPVDAVDPRNIQLYHRGMELAIEVVGQGDAIFHPADYIQFYGQANDGTLDEKLYEDPGDQPHQHYNLYSDTTAYFLTWTLDASSGKRISNFFENNVTNIPVETFHYGEALLVNTEEYSTGFTSGDYIQKTAFDQGEGWTGIQIQEGQEIDYTLTEITNTTSSSPNPIVEVQLQGRDDKAHNVEVLVGQNAGSLRLINTALFQNYFTHTITQEIEWTDISSGGDLAIRVKVLGVSGGNDLISVNYIKLTYPQSFDMSGRPTMHITLEENIGDKSYIEVLNKPAGTKLWDITDPTTPLIIDHNNIGSDLNAIVPNTAISRNILATSETLSPISIAQVNFTNFDPASYDYILISHQSMMQPAGGYGNVVTAYADYRASDGGGAYSPLVLDIEDLYDQFNYGERSPLAIYEVMKYLVDNGTPEHLFIIGKGLLVNISSGGTHYRKSQGSFSIKDLIPTAGVPGSDLTFTVGLAGVAGEVAVPTGRITTTDPAQVASYLDKVKTHESQPKDDLWRKRILHLSGGKTAEEQVRFKGYVDGFSTIAETHYLGGDVTSLKKQTSAVNEFISVTDEINGGLGMITFYGHSAPNITDIDIGFVSDPIHEYENKSQYPLILVNGCNAGQIFTGEYLWGEDWVFTPDKGAIGFIAHSYFGLESALVNYTRNFYQKAYSDISLIDQSVGAVQQATIQSYIQQYGVNISSETITQQMILEGDPAVVVFGAEKPDYATDNNSVFFQKTSGQQINVLTDEFTIGIITENFGRTETSDLNVRISRRLEDNTVINYDTVFSPVLYRDTLYVIIQNNVTGIEGRNIFEIELDYVNITDELDENNNSAVIEMTLLSNGTKNLLPADFSIETTTSLKLTTQSSNLLSSLDTRGYELQLDTVSTFDSAFKQATTISSEAIASWDVDLLTSDSTTYYWRTKFENPSGGESDSWQTSSFTYINNGNHGWLQKHRQQYNKNQYVGLSHDEINGEFSFENTSTDISVTTYGANHPTEDDESVELQIDNQQFIYSSRFCRDNTINIVAFNKLTTTPYAPIPSLFHVPQTCGRADQVINNFTYGDMSGASQYLKTAIDAIGDGDIVLIFSIGDPEFDNWDAGLKSQIERIGGLASTISSLDAGAPYILLGRKGAAPGSEMEVVTILTPADEQAISISETIVGVLAQGRMTSTIIGPSTDWIEFFDQVSGTDTDFNFEITGIDHDGNESVLSTTTNENESLASINAAQYPYLRLGYELDDPNNLTPTQLQHWGVHYQPVPEGILIMDERVDRLSVEEGELVTLGFQFINISTESYPNNLSVEYALLNRDSRISEEYNMTINPPAPSDTTFFSVTLSTIDKVGLNDFDLTVNPRILPEQYYDNNQVQLFEYLEVLPDLTSPVIDVVFDGAHIEDGGIVAANPLIEILVYDNNESIYITDTASVALFLKRDCEDCDFERLTYNSDSVTWSPASAEKQFRVLYTPSILTDSVYTLRVVASDASGNKPSDKPYEISFTTDVVASIKYHHPYPNPFSEEVNFIFEIRGSTPPDELTIDIYNPMGRLITSLVPSDLRIGLNSLRYRWIDENPSMPQGMYIYHITAKSGGKLIPINSSVSNGKGKLLLHK